MKLGVSFNELKLSKILAMMLLRGEMEEIYSIQFQEGKFKITSI